MRSEVTTNTSSWMQLLFYLSTDHLWHRYYWSMISTRDFVNYSLALATFAWTASTVDFNICMTFSGSGELNIAVPATITLLPIQEHQMINARRWMILYGDWPASAQVPIVLGPTPPSTSISLLGNRARSSATFGTQRSKNFWPPRPWNSHSNRWWGKRTK
jgi:hypothetical protein